MLAHPSRILILYSWNLHFSRQSASIVACVYLQTIVDDAKVLRRETIQSGDAGVNLPVNMKRLIWNAQQLFKIKPHKRFPSGAFTALLCEGACIQSIVCELTPSEHTCATANSHLRKCWVCTVDCTSVQLARVTCAPWLSGLAASQMWFAAGICNNASRVQIASRGKVQADAVFPI